MAVKESQNARRPLDVWLLAGFMGALVMFSTFLFAQRSWWLPEVSSVHGVSMDSEFLLTLVITGAMFILIHLALIFLLIGFGRNTAVHSRSRPSRGFESRFAILAATVILLVDLLLFLIGNASFRRFQTPAPADSLLVEVIGEQFAWNFRYPGPDGILGRTDSALIDLDNNPVGLDTSDPNSSDDILLINQMHVPVDRPVRLRIRAKDVIHSFSLPHFRVKQDAVPGMAIELWFVPTRTGEFEIVCNQLCGLGHYRMRAFLTVETDAEFQAWLRQQGGAD